MKSALTGFPQLRAVTITELSCEKGEAAPPDEPGLGIAWDEDMHRLLWDLAAHGKAILLISSDLQEVVRLSGRVIVMAEMSIRAEVENSHDYDEMSHVIMSKIVSVAGVPD